MSVHRGKADLILKRQHFRLRPFSDIADAACRFDRQGSSATLGVCIESGPMHILIVFAHPLDDSYGAVAI
jgi:hypothetical protein